MNEGKQMDLERLWRRVGLEELRKALGRIRDLERVFEKMLADLPVCDDCARRILFEKLERAGIQLGGEVFNVTTLAASLQKALAVLEKSRTDLAGSLSHTCRCPQEPCACHG